MKLVPTKQKIKIQWFWVSQDGTKYRNNRGFVHNAWDAKCSCGWESRTGGAIKTAVQYDVEIHKMVEHDYKWQFK